MRRSEDPKRKMGTVPKVLLWAFGILVLLAVIAAIYLAFKIFAVGGSIHNPLDRNKSELRKEKVDLNKGQPFSIALFGVDSDAQRKVKVTENVQILLWSYLSIQIRRLQKL